MLYLALKSYYTVKYILFKIFFFFFITLQAISQDLLPFVENYSKSVYQGDNQIWNVNQGNDNAIYFANNRYLLRYDGVKWEKNMLPNKTIIRSILIEGEKIYTGSYKEFGYWFRKDGAMHYVSISKGENIFDEKENEEIWKIFKLNGAIYFQTFNEIYIYKDKSVKKIKLPFLISYCFQVGNEILVASVKKGIFRLKKTNLEKIKGWSVIDNNIIHHIGEFQNKMYVFTKNNGVFVEDKGFLVPWQNQLNSILKKNLINCAKFINGNKLIIGTARKGIYVLNLNDNSYKNINRDNVLMNNSVLSINPDKEGNLWIGLDNGIAYMEVNSPISIFYDRSGALGSVYSVVKSDQEYLLASNHGVFKYSSQDFSLIPNSQGQAWDIQKVGQNYIIGHNEGTFMYGKDKYFKANDINGGWDFVKSNINDLHLQISYSGIWIYRNLNDLSNYTHVKGLFKPIRYVAQIKKNEIWAADNYRGLYRVSLNDAFETTKVENITKRSKINKDFGVKIVEFRGELLFLINNLWYTYNSISNQLIENTLFNTNFKNVSDLVLIEENHFLAFQNGLLYEVFANENIFIKTLIKEKYYKSKIINDNLKVFKTGKNFLLNLEDGFISIPLSNNKLKKAAVKFKVEAFNDDKLIKDKSIINFNSELKVHVISGIYGQNEPNIFFKLDNSDEFSTVVGGRIILNNLSNGSHELEVYYYDGLNYIQVDVFNFHVLKPWYFSFRMIVLYLLLIGGALFLYYRWNKMRYTQKLKLKEEDLKHQKKILEMKLKGENESKIQTYEKHILELELQTKSSEVAGKSLSIAKQSEMIENIQELLDSENDINRLKSEVKKIIKINAVNKQEWEAFEVNLNQVHSEFISNLSKKYPKLTPKDINLCIYLKMYLSSKDIAPIMNITYRGVELHRYRLRKKLQLSKDDNLTNFLLSI
ncbi:histidine kinase [Flavobacterium sp. 7A]|uniref:helix-turn-helix and ligand-binding sensor domain-containing protein n=1 Tax=Flavobacterium sp. 7A TaxID=2940571 RepID=UPI002226705B|nr:histidine kinase [Flavobacterium sp. 7A]MCW2120694.1 DNA-binding CsgD family transcriptional regulator [Flavobacterium sp. 7A]